MDTLILALVDAVLFTLYMPLLGAAVINETVKKLKEKQYFWFGWWLMTTIGVLTLFIKHIWR